MSGPIDYENTNTKLSTEVNDIDKHLQFQQLHTRIKELEKENNDIGERFNVQRGKLQKLYIQKENEFKEIKIRLESEVERLNKELDEAKSQLCIAGIEKENEVEAEKQKALSEIATLNKIVNESVDVLTTLQTEVKSLNQIIQVLQSQVKKLRDEKEKEGILLAPSNVLLGAKSFAKKVVGQLGNDSDFRSHDNLEDSMKKAQEDTEVLKSLVVPLEKKIVDLTEKLTNAEEKLKKYVSGDAHVSASDRKRSENNLIDLSCGTSQESGTISPRESDSKLPLRDDLFSSDNSIHQHVSAASPSKSVSCDMCVNYEAQLVAQQEITRQLQKEKEIIGANMERIKEGLIKETNFRKCMEDKWNEKKEEYKVQVSELKLLYENSERNLKSLRKDFEQVQEDVMKEVNSLRIDRKKINEDIKQLQAENDNLIGKYSAHSEQLRNESINFPDNVEDLQELLLKSHEELISAKVAKEINEEQVKTLKCEIQLLRDQMESDLLAKSAREKNLLEENSELRKQLEAKDRERSRLQNDIEILKPADKKNEEQIKNLTKLLEEVTMEKNMLDQTVSELRSRVGCLQQELDTGEAVQKDFVRLSQSLQVELEKIRGADSEVRWQHDEDATECLGCRTQFSGGRKKIHCRHCGKIFCSTCLSHVVYSGPNNRESHVCQVCHTLLNRETAPYFSQEPPHSPD